MAQTVDCATPEYRWTKSESISGVLERNTATQGPPYGQCTGEWQLKFNTITEEHLIGHPNVAKSKASVWWMS